MAVGKTAASDQRMPQDTAAHAGEDKALAHESAVDPRDSPLIRSAVAALGTPKATAKDGHRGGT